MAPSDALSRHAPDRSLPADPEAAEPPLDGPPPPRRPRWLVALVLGALAALLVGTRLAIASSLADVFFYGEELAKGAASKAILDGLDVPLHTLSYHYYEGGGFGVSFLTAGMFALVGPSVLAHKLVALGLDLVVLAAGFALVRRWFGLGAAGVFGLLHVFAPMGFQKLALLNLGHHAHALAFQYLVVHCALCIARRDRPASAGASFALGLVAGLGFWFDYQCAVAIGAAGLFLLARPRVLFAPRVLGPALVGAVIGALPLIAMASQVGARVFDVHGLDLLAGDKGPAFVQDESNPELMCGVPELADSPAAGTPSHFVLLGALPILGLVAHARSSVPPRRRRAYALVFTVGVLFALVVWLTGLGEDWTVHYFLVKRYTPIWGFATVATAATLGLGLGARLVALRAASLALALVLVGLGVRDTVAVVESGKAPDLASGWEHLATTKGYDYEGYIPYVGWHFGLEPAEQVRVFLGFDDEDPELVAASAPVALEKVKLELDEALALLDQVDAALRVELAAGLGAYLVRMSPKGYRKALRDVTEAELDDEMRDALYFAIARRGINPGRDMRCVLKEARILYEDDIPEAAWRGLGHRILHVLLFDPPRAETTVATIHPSREDAIRAGFEEAQRWFSLGR